MSKAVNCVEMDLDYCALRYGTTNGAGTCPAAIGVTGAIKCFNTLSTCQVRASFTNLPVTDRFALPTADRPLEIEAIPDIASISYNPPVISLGVDLGARSSLAVTFNDHPHSDTGPGGDPYLSDRPYIPFNQGTFWGKFRARQAFIRGRALRWIQGIVGQSLADMDTRHFVMESFTGPSLGGQFTVTAQDVLKLLDGDRAKAPTLSPGQLNADITAIATIAVLAPAGVGNTSYPASGWIAIGGAEIVSFTRSADTLTITRGQFNTVAATHNAGDRCQLCLYYHAQDPADVINDLATTYAGVDPAHISLSDWRAETAAFYRRLVTSIICEPTGVDVLVSELIEQCGLAIWWDDLGEQIRLQVLRAIATTAQRYDDSNVLNGTLVPSEQPDKRVSQVWTYFGIFNPLKGLDQIDNYRSTAITEDLNAEADYGQPAIKVIHSRWIPFGGLTTAQRVNAIILNRYTTAPRKFTFELFRRGPVTPMLGQGCRLQGFPMQDATGAREDVPVQIVSVRPRDDAFEVTAEEMLALPLSDGDPTQHPIIIDANVANFNMRAVHDALYPAPSSGDTVTCYVNTGVNVGSASSTQPAFDVGSWPVGVILKLYVLGAIEGTGGNGGAYDGSTSTKYPGHPGGTALYTRTAITVDVSSGTGEIWGGGGGGGMGGIASFGGGGGAGIIGGLGGASGGGGAPGQPGTATTPGIRGGTGGTVGGPGSGGTPGTAGVASSAAGGAAGNSIDGVSYVTLVGTGSLLGPQVN
jgi:hypothetical protein